jgi:hypothetical protein
MSPLRACFPPLCAALLLTACVAKDPGWLGGLESDDASTGGSDSSGATAGDGNETCSDPARSYYEPITEVCAEPVVPLLPEAGCYEECHGPDASCTVGVCTQVQTQLDECDAECCVLLIELCLGDAPDTVCDQIVGTTFSSVEEIICFPTEEGEEPVYCHSWVEFEEDGSFLWMEADFGQGGTYTCEDGVLTLEGLDVGFSFDPATAVLTWDGKEYVPDTVCEQIVGTTFLSVEQLECGLGPDGPVLCNWQITFEEDGDYLWMYSDVGDGGTYSCQGGNLFISGENDLDFDPATGILTWDGVEYAAAP